MVLLRISFNFFEKDWCTLPQPRIESLTSLLSSDGHSRNVCSCEQIQNHRSVVRSLGPTFSFLLLNEQSLENLVTDFAVFSSKIAGLFSQEHQEDLLFSLKTHCNCNDADMLSAVIILRMYRSQQSVDLQLGNARSTTSIPSHRRKPKPNILHSVLIESAVLRQLPLVLYVDTLDLKKETELLTRA